MPAKRRAGAGTSALLTWACLLLLAGCGSGGSSSDTASPDVQSPKLTPAQRAPKGASTVEREIYRQFPPPKPNPEVKGSAKAIAAGEKACRGRSPVEVKEEFFAEASSRLNPGQETMIEEIGRYEKLSGTETSFTAGQLAAGTYEATLPEAVAIYGYQGCVYSLARGLKHELAQGRKYPK
jgi:hypothetical protein